MKITDLEGMEITITDLDTAIEVTELFKGYRHTDKRFAQSDRKRKAYWEDILEKLKKIKQQNNKL